MLSPLENNHYQPNTSLKNLFQLDLLVPNKLGVRNHQDGKVFGPHIQRCLSMIVDVKKNAQRMVQVAETTHYIVHYLFGGLWESYHHSNIFNIPYTGMNSQSSMYIHVTYLSLIGTKQNDFYGRLDG